MFVKTAKVRDSAISYGKARNATRGTVHAQIADDAKKSTVVAEPVAVTAYFIEGRPEQLIVHFDAKRSTVKWREQKSRFIGIKASKLKVLLSSSKTNAYRAYKLVDAIKRNEATPRSSNDWKNPLKETQPNPQFARLLSEENARIRSFGESTKREFLERAKRAREILKGTEGNVLAGSSIKSRKT